jgi:predicted nuclease with TOPRIM domain
LKYTEREVYEDIIFKLNNTKREREQLLQELRKKLQEVKEIRKRLKELNEKEGKQAHGGMHEIVSSALPEKTIQDLEQALQEVQVPALEMLKDRGRAKEESNGVFQDA